MPDGPAGRRRGCDCLRHRSGRDQAARITWPPRRHGPAARCGAVRLRNTRRRFRRPTPPGARENPPTGQQRGRHDRFTDRQEPDVDDEGQGHRRARPGHPQQATATPGQDRPGLRKPETGRREDRGRLQAERKHSMMYDQTRARSPRAKPCAPPSAAGRARNRCSRRTDRTRSSSASGTPSHLRRHPTRGAGRGRERLRRSHRPACKRPRGTAACPARRVAGPGSRHTVRRSPARTAAVPGDHPATAPPLDGHCSALFRCAE